jgi:hypothetical protein
LFTRPSGGLLDVEIVRTLLHGAGSGLPLVRGTFGLRMSPSG